MTPLFRRRRRDDELDEEMRTHLQMATRERIERGESPEKAAAAARREFGNVDLVREVTRDMWGWRWLDQFKRDVRHALRTMRRSPGYTAIVIVTLALGIGANTAIFTIVNAVLLEPLPFRDPDRLVMMWEETARRPGKPNTVGPANFLRWRDRATAFEQMAALYDTRMSLAGVGEAEELVVQVVTPEFFPTLGVGPALGRVFARGEGADQTPAPDRVTILSHQLWLRRFGGSAAVVGRAIRLGGRLATVVGVMPPDARLFVPAGSLVGKPPDAWLPFQFAEEQRKPSGRYLTAVGRLKGGVPLEQAQSQMDTIASGLRAEWPDFDTGWTARLVPLHTELAGDIRPALLVLLGAVAFVLLIACANVANLLLARGAARHREFAIRTALGAGRGQMVRQLLTETLVLALLGAAGGLVVARWGTAFLVALSPVDLVGLGRVRINLTVLGFTAAACIATVAICGFAPAIDAARSYGRGALGTGARQAGSTRENRRLRHLFVVAEVALAVVVLVGAILLIRSFWTLSGVEPGFDQKDVVTMRVSLPSSKYGEAGQRLRFFQSAVDRASALPGVRAAGVVSFLPFAGLGAATNFTIEGRPAPPPGQDLVTEVRVCDNGYFEAMRIPLLRGRLFEHREMQEASNVVIINSALARQYFPGEDPLGKRLVINMTDPLVPTRIVGVAGDVRQADLATEIRPMAYWPHPQLPYSAMTLTVRTAGEPLTIAPMVEHEVRVLDPDQPVSDVRSMEQWIARSLQRARFTWMILTVFAGLALFLTSIGIYGVMSYSVRQRAAEMGVRLALGAHGRQIVRMVVGTGLQLTVSGLAVGAPLALVLTQAIDALLFGVTPTDPVALTSAIGVVGTVALAASYIPARRAARTNPVEVLRQE
ncbi:MAG TPA: ABC transporter permease [Vicinamibacterales bacterium]|jgi:putative ABC transport system permease protein